jgi:hypothetical protein
MPTRRVLRLLLLIELVVVALIARQSAYVTTYRLFVDRAVGGTRSAATQQFGIDGGPSPALHRHAQIRTADICEPSR